MIFHKTKYSNEYQLSEALISEDGNIIMGVYPVMFGYRIRAGYTNFKSFEIDWCCGDSQKMVELVYSCLKSILESRITKNAFDGLLPFSQIKPLFNDAEFFKWMLETVGSFKEVKLKPVSEMRNELMSTFNHE